MRLVVVVAIAAGGCIGVPPSQSTFGALGTAGAVAYRASAGASSAAAHRADGAMVDLGAGWVTEGGADRPAVHGTYLSLGRRLAAVHRGLWLSARAEQFWLVDTPGLPLRGVAARVAYRYHLTGGRAAFGDSSGWGAVYGGVAVGLYADVSARELDGGAAELVVSAGVSLDLPLFAGGSKIRVY